MSNYPMSLEDRDDTNAGDDELAVAVGARLASGASASSIASQRALTAVLTVANRG